MKKLISYIFCIIGLVFVMCGSVGAVDFNSSNSVVFRSDRSGNISTLSFSYDTPVFFPDSKNSFCYGLRVALPPSQVTTLFSFSGVIPCYYATNTCFVFPSVFVSSSNLVPFYPSTSSSSNSPYSYLSSSVQSIIPPHSNPIFVFIYAFSSGNSQQGCFISSSASYFLTPIDPVQSSVVVPLLQQIAANSSGGNTPSAMDKFENDYLGNEFISGQLDKTEHFISPSNPGLPNGGDIGGFAEQIQNGMGFNGSSFDSEKFQQATDAFNVDSTSTGEGGMWWFFSQDVADSLAHNDVATVSADDGQSLQDAWVEQIKRRWGNW